MKGNPSLLCILLLFYIQTSLGGNQVPTQTYPLDDLKTHGIVGWILHLRKTVLQFAHSQLPMSTLTSGRLFYCTEAVWEWKSPVPQFCAKILHLALHTHSDGRSALCACRQRHLQPSGISYLLSEEKSDTYFISSSYLVNKIDDSCCFFKYQIS